jgi:hypothetical protein
MEKKKREYNIFNVVSIIWTDNSKIFRNLHNLFYLQLTTNQEPLFIVLVVPHYLLHVHINLKKSLNQIGYGLDSSGQL